MAGAFVREVAAGTSIATAATTLAIPVENGSDAGNTLFLVIEGRQATATITNITDSSGNTWSADAFASNATPNRFAACCSSYQAVALDPGDTILVTFDDVAGASLVWWVEEFSGIYVNGRDKTGTFSGAGPNPTVTTTSDITYDDEIAIIGFCTSGTGGGQFTPDVDFTSFPTPEQYTTGATPGDTNGMCQYLIASDTATLTATCPIPAVGGVDQQVAGFIATYRALPETLYGVTFGTEGNSNTTVGEFGTPQAVAYRERITHTGTITVVNVYFKAGVGYSGGTGGTIRLRVCADDGTANHFPNLSSVLSTLSVSPGNTSQVGVYTLSPSLAVTSGDLVHFVWDNTDGSPTVNFISVNGLELRNEPAQHQPGISNVDRGQMHRFGAGAWSEQTDRYPILNYTFADAVRGGQGYYEALSGGPFWNVGGTSRARLNFVSSADRVVYAANVWVYKQSGTTRPLTVSLQNSAGVTLQSGTIALADVPQDDANFVRVVFGAPQALVSGQRYFLELSSPLESTPYITYGVEGGGGSAFGTAFRANIFDDGYGEYTTNGSTWNLQGGTQAFKAMFYLETQPAVPPPPPGATSAARGLLKVGA